MNRYYYKNEFEYILISELPEDQQEDFSKFMYGQTMPLIFNEETKEYINDAVYSWDYDNWLEYRVGRGFWD